MKSRSLGVFTLTTLLVGATSVVGATTAHAVATHTVDIGACTGGVYSLSSTSVTIADGDTIGLHDISGLAVNATISSGGSVGIANNTTSSFGGVTGSGTITVSNVNGSPTCSATITFSNGASGDSSSGGPAEILQAFGLPASGTCATSQPANINWAGVGSGGWANSWAQWVNGGKGGPVCIRTLVYSTTQAKWIVR